MMRHYSLLTAAALSSEAAKGESLAVGHSL